MLFMLMLTSTPDQEVSGFTLAAALNQSQQLNWKQQVFALI